MKVKALVFLLALGFSLSSFATEDFGIANPKDDGSKYGKDSVTCVMNLSLYREFYKQWKGSRYKNTAIDDAYGPWRWVFDNCPRASQNIYIDGVKMVKHKVSKSENKDIKEQMIDSLMLIYKRRIEYYPAKKGKILGRMGVDLYKLRPSAYVEVSELLRESFDIDGDKTAGPVFIYFFRAITKMAKHGEIDTAQVVETYDRLTGYLDTKLMLAMEEGNAKKQAEFENIIGNIENTFSPFAQCPDLVRIYQQKFDKAPDDIELLRKITSLLDKKKCIDDPLYFESTVALYELDPSPESAYLIGKMMMKQSRFKEAIPYMEEATKMENVTKVDDAYIFLAEVYRALDNYPRARQMAMEAAKLNPEDGNPYVIIGDMYAASAKACGDNDLTRKVAYWAAVDKYQKAKRVDPELTDAMNKRIRSYQAHFPPTEVLFFYDLTEGDEYTVSCWIGEKTKVRAAK